MSAMKRNLIFMIFTLLALGACNPASEPPIVEEEPEPTEVVGESLPQQSEHSEQEALVFETSAGEEVDYLLYLPEALEAHEDWPMILYLHGSDGNGNNIEVVRLRSLAVWAAPEDLSQFIVVSPQLPRGNWNSYFEQVDELLEELMATLPVKAEAVFVTGYSIGGLGSWEYALRAPERLAGLAPVAGGPTGSTLAPVPDDICALTESAIWVFQGDADTAVPIERNTAAVAALAECGNESVQYTVYEGVNHGGTWPLAYADPALYAWMLEQAK